MTQIENADMFRATTLREKKEDRPMKLAVTLTGIILMGSLALAQDSTKNLVPAPKKDTLAVAAPKDTAKNEMVKPPVKTDSVKSPVPGGTVKPDSMKTPASGATKTDSSKAADTTRTKTALQRAQERAKAAAEKAKANLPDSLKKVVGGSGVSKGDSAKPVVKVPMTKLPTGVEYHDIKVGEGTAIVMSDKVICHYTVWFADKGEKGKKLQSSHDSNQPFACQLGVGVIPGWSDGMVGMKPGGIRELHVPYSQAWGEQGIPNAIPPRTDIIFEIEYIEPCTETSCIPDPDPRMHGMLKYVGSKH